MLLNIIVFIVFIVRAAIDLSLLERDKTHSLNVELEDGAGFIHLLVTITGIASYHFNGTSTTAGSENPTNALQKMVSIA